MSPRRSRSGGRRDADARQPVVEIGAEGPPLRPPPRDRAGSSATTRARAAISAGAAHPPQPPRLEHAQQLGLQIERQLADLVEEQRAARGLLEPAGAPRRRAGEGAALVPEELALGQLARERAAVRPPRTGRPGWARARGARAPGAPCRCRSRPSTSTGVVVGATSAARASAAAQTRDRLRGSRPAPFVSRRLACAPCRPATDGGCGYRPWDAAVYAPEADPGFAALANLLLPDRRAQLQAIDRGAAGLEGRRAVLAPPPRRRPRSRRRPARRCGGGWRSARRATRARSRPQSRPAPPRPSRGRPRTPAGRRRAGGARAAGRSRRR